MQKASYYRLYVDDVLAPAKVIRLARDKTHYLVNVLRSPIGGRVLLFNGRDGEYEAEITSIARNAAELTIKKQTRIQDKSPSLMLAFAPVKRARIDFIAEKATELGVGIIQPVLTEYTAVSRVNIARMQANAIEAAEQTHRLTIPEIAEPVALRQLLCARPAAGQILFCDEKLAGEIDDAMLKRIASLAPPVAVLIGPEGGFSQAEREMLLSRKDTVAISLGKNILRADTAVVAALAICQTLANSGKLWR